MSEPRRVHVEYIEGLRGAAALFVVIHHIWWFVATQVDLHVPFWFKALTVFKYGPYAVVVFIVLSGYCLMMPVARSAGSELPGGLRTFAVRRARRILIPYYAALGLTLLLIAVYPRVAMPGHPTFAADNLIAHLLLVHNWFEHLQWQIDPPMWSTGIEWQIYFVFALGLLPLWRRFGALATVAVAFAVGLAPIFFGYKFASPWFLGLFALGMTAAAINFTPGFAFGPREPASWERWALGLAVVVAGLTAAKIPALEGPHPLIDTVLALATCAFLIASTRRLQLGLPPNLLARVFEHRLATALGVFSYSVYLVHCPVLKVIDSVVSDLGIRGVSSFMVTVFAGVPPTLLIAYGFHRLFERPFMTVVRAPLRAASASAEPAPPVEQLKSVSG